MKHDKKSFLAGLSVGVSLKGWATALKSGLTMVRPVEVRRHMVPVVVQFPQMVIPVTVYEEVT